VKATTEYLASFLFFALRSIIPVELSDLGLSGFKLFKPKEIMSKCQTWHRLSAVTRA